MLRDLAAGTDHALTGNARAYWKSHEKGTRRDAVPGDRFGVG
jgi:hypothetical protein